MDYDSKDYPHSGLTEQIIRAAFYVANGYKRKGLKNLSFDLHNLFRDDLAALLIERNIHTVTEEFFPRPLREGLINRKKVRHFADLMVSDQVLAEIKVGNKDYVDDKKSLLAFEGQALNTLEYSGLKLMLLFRLSNDGNFKVTVSRYIL
ncbi:MAG: hypothetical protein PHV30_07670 [Candidatus Margulisbacteria bacterium]|nr:hypothetical protein [Candidatus Margulisiibacteriota bacterium]